MGQPNDVSPGRLPYRRAVWDDDDALELDRAASAGAVVHGPTGGAGVTNAWDGAEHTAKVAGQRTRKRIIIVKTTASGGSATFKVGAANAWTLTGLVDGISTTEQIVLTTTDGGDVVKSVNAYDDPDGCTLSRPAQNNATAHYRVGLGDCVAPKGEHFRGITANAAGAVVVTGDDGNFETLALALNQTISVLFKSVVATGTAIDITIYA